MKILNKTMPFNDDSSPLLANGVKNTSRKSGRVETSRICKSLKFLSDSDDEDIDAKFSSLSDRLSKRADVINNIRFDLLKTESVTTKLIGTTNESCTKCYSDNTQEFTAAQWKKIKHEYTKNFTLSSIEQYLIANYHSICKLTGALDSIRQQV